jgi:hypothetical protein
MGLGRNVCGGVGRYNSDYAINASRVKQSWRTRETMKVVHRGEMRNATRIAVKTPEGRGCFEGVDVNVRARDDMKNDVFWDIRTHFLLHRRHVTFPLQSSAS